MNNAAEKRVQAGANIDARLPRPDEQFSIEGDIDRRKIDFAAIAKQRRKRKPQGRGESRQPGPSGCCSPRLPLHDGAMRNAESLAEAGLGKARNQPGPLQFPTQLVMAADVVPDRRVVDIHNPLILHALVVSFTIYRRSLATGIEGPSGAKEKAGGTIAPPAHQSSRTERLFRRFFGDLRHSSHAQRPLIAPGGNRAQPVHH